MPPSLFLAFLPRWIIALGVIGSVTFAQPEAPSWVDFAERSLTGRMADSTLLDFSYSGYHFSERELPNVSAWTHFDVTDYGAVPNDGAHDDDGIRAAIAAAQASSGPAVVYFPAGKFRVSDETNATAPFIISRSQVVLKGAGSGTGGTEIYADWSGGENAGGIPTNGGDYRFVFRPEATARTTLTYNN